MDLAAEQQASGGLDPACGGLSRLAAGTLQAARLWTAASDYQGDASMSDKGLGGSRGLPEVHARVNGGWPPGFRPIRYP
jgi:hypothetical protein